MTKACPDCGAPLKDTDALCWLCRARSHDGKQDVNPYASPQPIAGSAVKNQFSLATLFLIMTLAAVAMGALMVAPGLGTVLIVIAVPALVRATIAGRRRIESGEAPTVQTKILDFVTSAAIVWAISIAFTIAFAVTCLATGLPFMAVSKTEELAIWVGLASGLAGGGIVATWLLWITRPKSRASVL